MATAIPMPNWQTSADGATLAVGAKIYFWVPGTSTPRTPFSDSALTVPTTNPVILNASGWPETNIYLSSDLAYEYEVKSADDATTYVPRKLIPSNIAGAQPLNTKLTSIANQTPSAGDFQTWSSATAASLTPAATVYGAHTANTFAAARLKSPFEGQIIRILGRSAVGDYGGGLYRSATSALSDNDGTVLVCANGQRLIFIGDYCTPEQWGGTTGAGGNCTAAWNTWRTEMKAGRAPKWWHMPQEAIYRFTSNPNALDDVGTVRVTGAGALATSVYKAYTSADVTEGIFRFQGATFPIVGGFNSRVSDNHEGGCIIRLQSTFSNAVANAKIFDVYMTFENSPAKTVTGATSANPGVFTSAAHGFSDGDRVVLVANSTDINWLQWNNREWTISDATTDTFTLTEFGSATKLNTTGYGAFSSMLVTRCRAPHAHIDIDGTLKTTGAIGVRVVELENCTIFGAGHYGAVHVNGGVSVSIDSGCVFSGGGLNAAVVIEGSASVNSFYTKVDACSIDGIREDRSVGTTVTAFNQGSHLRTANTQDSAAHGKVSGFSQFLGTRNSGRDYIPLSGGRVLQRKAITGVTGSAATFTFPFAFKTAPVVWAHPITGATTDANVITSSITTTGVDVAGQNLTSGNVEIFAVGEMA